MFADIAPLEAEPTDTAVALKIVRWLAPALALLALAATMGQPAAADQVISTEKRPATVNAYGGRLVWSSYDPTRRSYSLMSRFQGVSAVVPIKPRKVPFDVDLGPSPPASVNHTWAVYSRCKREPKGVRRTNDLPNWGTATGCRLYRFDFSTGKEKPVRIDGLRGTSKFLPTIWKGRLAFAADRRKRSGPHRINLYLGNLRLGNLTGLGRLQRTPGGPRGKTGLPGPTGMDLNGSRLAFTWNYQMGKHVWRSQLRLGRASGRHRLIDKIGSGELGIAEINSPTIVGSNLFYAKFNNSSRNKQYRRYDIRSRKYTSAYFRRYPVSVAWDGDLVYYLKAPMIIGGFVRGGGAAIDCVDSPNDGGVRACVLGQADPSPF